MFLFYPSSLCPTHFGLKTDYELGRLLACQGDTESAEHEFELVLSGKPLEVGASGRKGKYSMEVRTVTMDNIIPRDHSN